MHVTYVNCSQTLKSNSTLLLLLFIFSAHNNFRFKLLNKVFELIRTQAINLASAFQSKVFRLKINNTIIV